MANQPLIRLVHIGHLKAPQTFSWGLTLAAPAQPSQADFDTWLAAVGANFNTWATTATTGKALLSAEDGYTQLKAYYLPTGSNKSSLESEFDVAQPGGVSRTLPYQCAVVHSFRSAVPGRSGRGRAYVPIGNSNGQLNGQLTAPTCTALANAMATYLESFFTVDLGATAPIPVVASPLDSSTPRAINKVIVDSVIDTQQRRRDKTAAVASASAVVS